MAGSKAQTEDSTLARGGCNRDVAVMQAHYLARHCKSNAAAAFSCCEEWNENLIDDSGQNAGAIVFHFHNYTTLPVDSCANLKARLLGTSKRPHCIAIEIDKDLLNEIGVASQG